MNSPAKPHADYRRHPRIVIRNWIRVHFPWLLLTVFGILLLVFSVFTIWIATPIQAPESPKTAFEFLHLYKWRFTTAQAAFYAAVSGAIFTGAGFFAALIGMATSIKDRRKERAHLITSEWNTAEITRDLRLLRERAFPILDKYGDRPALGYDLILRNSDLFDAVRRILNILEDWAIAVESGYVDRGVIEASMIDVFLHYHAKLRPFIDEARTQNEGGSTYFRELEIFVSYLKTKKDKLERAAG